MRNSKNDFQILIKILVIALCFTNFNGAYSQCTTSDWVCDNGECVQDDKLCDGKVDCRDGSDEIPENCMQFHETCQNFAFRCAYGACIDGKAKCNGVQDCADNSDELICIKTDDSDFQGTCSDGDIQCVTSKECINSIKLCDGRADCKDGSDESLPLCINYGCTSYGFQCGYGACINGNAKCNGRKECADGSDEAWELCNTPRKQTNLIGTPTPKPIPTPTPTRGQVPRCLIPNIPALQDMTFKLHPQNETISLGSYVEDFEIVHVECKNKVTLRGTPSLLCQSSQWNDDFPSCVAYCDASLLLGLSIKAICDYTKHHRECPKKIKPGTDIQVNCAYGYTRTPDNPQYLKCLPDGTFDKKPLRCEENCGKVSPDSQPLSKGGIPIPVSKAPWHVAIYEFNSVDYIYICSGSIVAPRVIISAAHCFWDEPNLIAKTYAEYQIIAGKSTSNYTTEHDSYSQLIQVETLVLPKGYKGKGGRQKDDIAFVKLKVALRYSETIAPICIPRELPNTAKYVRSNTTGFINGFGEENQLQRLQMITLAYYECLDRSPVDSTIADDKFCIYNTQSGAVCRGDSGGGFFTETKLLDEIVFTYRIWGVISNTPTTTNDCTRTNEQAYVAITNIQYMADEFRKKLKAAIEDDQTLF